MPQSHCPTPMRGMRVFLLGAPLLLVAAGGKETCPLGPIESVASKQAAVYRAASVNAELVAPSATTPSRRRSVGRGGTNVIDKWISAKETQDGVVPTTLSSDEEFLR